MQILLWSACNVQQDRSVQHKVQGPEHTSVLCSHRSLRLLSSHVAVRCGASTSLIESPISFLLRIETSLAGQSQCTLCSAGAYVNMSGWPCCFDFKSFIYEQIFQSEMNASSYTYLSRESNDRSIEHCSSDFQKIENLLIWWKWRI